MWTHLKLSHSKRSMQFGKPLKWQGKSWLSTVRLPEQLCSYELLKSINYQKDDRILNWSFRVLEPSSKNFQQVFHFRFSHSRQRCRCFRMYIDRPSWLIQLVWFHLSASAYEKTLNSNLVRQIISGCYQYLHLWHVLFWGIHLGFSFRTTGCEIDHRNIFQRKVGVSVGKWVITLHESLMSVYVCTNGE